MSQKAQSLVKLMGTHLSSSSSAAVFERDWEVDGCEGPDMSLLTFDDCVKVR